VPAGRVVGQHFSTTPQVRVHPGVGPGQRLGAAALPLQQVPPQRFPLQPPRGRPERVPAAQQLVQHHAQREHVGAGVQPGRGRGGRVQSPQLLGGA